MRRLALVLILASCAVTPLVANGAVLPGREPVAQAATNPNPFPPPPAATPQPAPTPTPTTPPVIVNPTPAPQVTVERKSEFFDWLQSAILGLIAMIFGVRTAGEFRKPNIGAVLSSDEFRRRVDEQALKLIETGMPGRLLQGVIPGGAFAEPLIRRIATELLEKRIAELGGGVIVEPKGPDQPVQQVPIDILRRILDRLDGKKDEPGK